MDLIQIILPAPSEFRILLPSQEEIRIIGYEKIDIDFCDRIIFRDGKETVVQSPMITYQIILDDKSKKQLKTIFSDCLGGTGSTIQTRSGKVKLGRNGYIFNVEITGRPDMKESFLLSSRFKDFITVRLKLESTNISLFDRAKEAYEKYSRFELLDL